MEQQVAEEKPGVDLLREGEGDRGVPALRVGGASREPGVLAFEEQAVVMGEPVAVTEGLGGGLAGRADERVRREGRGQPVVAEGEGRILRGGPAKLIEGGEMPAEAGSVLAAQSRP
ncbi:MAG: hypothetical protein R2882_08000 [Gemmatimonadales bacterium]